MLKGEMSMLNVLLLEELDINAIATELQKKHDEAPQFFMQSPLIVDCTEVADKLEDDASALDLSALKGALLESGFIPVGLRNAPPSMNAAIMESGWAVMRATPKDSSISSTKQKVENTATETETTETNEDEDKEETGAPVQEEDAVGMKSSMTVERPVRSGQQVYAADADMTILSPTSAGSEVVADGSIHIYGALRGRVLAGARGDTSARIYCQSLQAELIAIAGRYQLLDESDTALKGKPAMIRLEGEKLIIEALA